MSTMWRRGSLVRSFSGCFSVVVLRDLGLIVLSSSQQWCTSRSAIAERPRCRVGQFWPNVTGRRYFADIRGLTFNHCDVGLIGLQSYQIWRNNAKSEPLRRSRSFKVTDVGTNRKPICDFLLVINTNWHPISYHFEVIADYWLNFGHFAFLSPLWGLKYNACCSA